MSKLNKFINRLNIAKLNLALVVILFAFLAYTLFAPITPAVYNRPEVLNSNSLYSGHTITYKIYTCRKVGDGVITTVTRQLEPADNKTLSPIVLSTDTLSNPARCITSTRTLLIPASTPEGKYRLVIRGVYAVIPLRKPITVTAQSDPIEIKSESVDQTIQDLIDTNNLLQQQLQDKSTKESTAKPSNGSTSAPINSGAVSSSTTTSTPSSSTPQTTTNNNSTTNNTTTNNTTNNPPQESNDGLIQSVIKAIGGGIRLSL